MAFTTPFTAVVGTLIKSSDWNSSARDNLNHFNAVLAGSDSRLVSPLAWGDRPKGSDPVALGTGSTTIYTVPANTIAIVTKIRVASYHTSGITATATAAGKNVIEGEPVGSYDTLEVDCFLVLTAGQTVAALASVGAVSYGSVVKYEIPSGYSGANFRAASGTTLTANVWSTLITPTAGKDLTIRFLALETGATKPTRIALGVNSKNVIEIPGTGENVYRWNGEIQVPQGVPFQVFTNQALDNWILGAWETV